MNKISDTKTEIKYGIFSGIAIILYFSTIWMAFPREAFGVMHYYSSSLIFVAFMFIAVKKEDQLRGRDWDFRQVAQVGFVTYMIGSIFFWIFYYMMHQLNPEIVEYQRADMLVNAKDIFPKEQLARQLQNIKSADMSVTLMNAFTGFLKGSFPAFFIAFFIAIINRMQNR